MPGKWSRLKGQVPLAPVEQGWQDKVNAAKSQPKVVETNDGDLQILSPPLIQLSKVEKARRYCELRDQKDRLEDQISDINVSLEALSQLMIAEMENEGTDLFRLDSGDSLSIKDEPYSSVNERPKFIEWINSTNQQDLLSVNYQTMNSMVKNRLEQGLSAPPGIKVFLKQSITRRRARS